MFYNKSISLPVQGASNPLGGGLLNPAGQCSRLVITIIRSCTCLGYIFSEVLLHSSSPARQVK